jgi:hypothetical protein
MLVKCLVKPVVDDELPNDLFFNTEVVMFKKILLAGFLLVYSAMAFSQDDATGNAVTLSRPKRQRKTPQRLKQLSLIPSRLNQSTRIAG